MAAQKLAKRKKPRNVITIEIILRGAMTQRGFNLIEMTLVMALIVGLGAFTYKLFKPSASMAAIRTEQSRAGQIVQSLTDLYVLQPSYAGLSTATLESTYNSKFVVRHGTLDTPSSVGASAIVQPGTAFGTNDSIDLIYQSVPSGSCVNLATALARSADFVRINSVEVQKPYSKLREDLLATQCATRNGNEVLFRHTNKSVSSQATDMLACECSPTIETQTLACPDNASGSITQRRNATCPATSCPSRQWTSWVTISNTCGANAAPIPMIDPHAPQAACVPITEQRVSNCPSNQIGFQSLVAATNENGPVPRTGLFFYAPPCQIMITDVMNKRIHIQEDIMSYIKQTGDVIVSSGADTQNLLADEVQRSAGVTAVMMIKNAQQDEKLKRLKARNDLDNIQRLQEAQREIANLRSQLVQMQARHDVMRDLAADILVDRSCCTAAARQLGQKWAGTGEGQDIERDFEQFRANEKNAINSDAERQKNAYAIVDRVAHNWLHPESTRRRRPPME
ncbi:type 4 pilus major pilin [Stenotrophomonas maltophilia]